MQGALLSVTAHTFAQRESWEQESGLASSIEVTLCHSYLCPDAAVSHREVIWLIIPMTIEWGPCLPEGGELTPQKP